MASPIGQLIGLVRSTCNIVYRKTPRIQGKKLRECDFLCYGLTKSQKIYEYSFFQCDMVQSLLLKNKSPQPFGQNHHLLVIHQNDKQGGKRRDAPSILSKPFRKHGIFLQLHTRETTRKVILQKSREWTLLKKECPHNQYHDKTGKVYNIAQYVVGIVLNQQAKDKSLAKKINVHVENATQLPGFS